MSLVGRAFPDLPELGQENTHYGKIAHKAEKQGDVYTRSAYKVAQYITLAHEAGPGWPEKLKYYRYALEKHAVAQPPIDDEVWAFYEGLKQWVRRECGADALRLASIEDDMLAERKKAGEPRFKIVSEAAKVFPQMVPAECPDWFLAEDWQQLRLIQLQWA